MTILDAFPILGCAQSLMGLGYLVIRRRERFSRAITELATFACFAFAAFDFPNMVALYDASRSFAMLSMLAWTVLPMLALFFVQDITGLKRADYHRKMLFMAIPSLILGSMALMSGDSCTFSRPCVTLPRSAALWNLLVAMVVIITMGRALLHGQSRILSRPMGSTRMTISGLIVGILFFRIIAQGSILTGADATHGTAQGCAIAIAALLLLISLLTIRLFPEPPEDTQDHSESEQVHQFRRHLAQAVVFEEGGVGPLIRGTVLTTILTVLALIAWSGITPVKESAVTFGSVVPSSTIRPIQHLEGGIVQEVLVREGQMVEAGDVLLRMDPTQARSELEQMKVRESGLLLKAERLRAFAAGRTAVFLRTEDEGLAQDQDSILNAQNKARETAIAVLDKQIDQKTSDIALYQRQINAIRPQIALLGEEVAIRDELAKKGLTSQVVLFNTLREYERLTGELSRLEGQMQSAGDALAEAQQRRADMANKLSQDALNEMGSVTAELAQIREGRLKLEDRVTRLDVVAPVRGLIQELSVTSPGTVIQQGALVTKIVPVDDVLMVENQITPRDIGHVHAGQPVRVKVTSYDFARFGAVEGKLTQVSPSTFMDEKKNPYYKGTVALEKSYVGDEPQHNQILPGMTVQVDIITGEKTILQYLLKPLYVAATQAFRER